MNNNHQASNWRYLARKPGSNYQQLFVRGRNIAARTLYGLTFPGEDWPGMTPEQLAADYDLPLEAVQEAIAYCQADPPELQADWEMDEALVKATEAKDRTSSALSPEEHEQLVRRFRQ